MRSREFWIQREHAIIDLARRPANIPYLPRTARYRHPEAITHGVYRYIDTRLTQLTGTLLTRHKNYRKELSGLTDGGRIAFLRIMTSHTIFGVLACAVDPLLPMDMASGKSDPQVDPIQL